MSLTTWFTLLRKTGTPKKSSCPYKLEPNLCGTQSQPSLDWLGTRSSVFSKQSTHANGRAMRKILIMRWLIVMWCLSLVFLTSCAGRVVLLESGEMIALDNGRYSVSEEWVSERLHFENDMVKRLSECNDD